MEDAPRDAVSQVDDEVDELEARSSRFDDISLETLLPPVPPEAPREPSGSPRRPVLRFVPWFFGIAAIVGIERVSMVFVVSESVADEARAVAFAVFVAMVLLVMTVGGWLFARSFGR